MVFTQTGSFQESLFPSTQAGAAQQQTRVTDSPQVDEPPATATSFEHPATELLKHPSVWRAGQLATQQRQERQGIATGYDELDQHLPDQGWPAAGMVEFMLPCAGVGELRLLMPALQQLSQTQERWVAWVNPPFIPYAPALQAQDVDINRILLIHPKSRNRDSRQQHKDALWALERACRSATCSMVLAWLDERQLRPKDTQRLQLAARQGGTLLCLFRPPEAAKHASMAELRIALQGMPEPGRTTLDIIKRRGGWSLPNITLPVAEVTATQPRPPRDVQEQLQLWRANQTRTDRQPDNPDTSNTAHTAAADPFNASTPIGKHQPGAQVH